MRQHKRREKKEGRRRKEKKINATPLRKARSEIELDAAWRERKKSVWKTTDGGLRKKIHKHELPQDFALIVLNEKTTTTPRQAGRNSISGNVIASCTQGT